MPTTITDTCLSGVAGAGAGLVMLGDVDGDVAVREDGGAAGVSPESREDGASSITVTSTLFLGDGDRDLGQGGSGEPPVEDPSGDGRSIEGDGDGDGDSERGEVVAAAAELLLFEDLGVSGLEAPGDMEVGLGDSRWLAEAGAHWSSRGVAGCCTGEEGEEVDDEDEAAEDKVDVEEEEIQMGSSSCSAGGGDCAAAETGSGVWSLASASSSLSSVRSPPRQLSSCSCITLSSIWRTLSFSGDKSSSSSVLATVLADSLSASSDVVTSPLTWAGEEIFTGVTLSR